ncbi:MAG: caspase family protein [Muribaculaceae bacterium]|nr:caspase family protein [Muribaculaceae bacterium]
MTDKVDNKVSEVKNKKKGKQEKIKITGTLYEPVTMMIGDGGETEVVTSLPYVFSVDKEMLPVRLTFISDKYIYHEIDVPKKPFDTTGHIYLLKLNDNAMALQNSGVHIVPQQPVSSAAPTPTPRPTKKPEFDPHEGVNDAPKTNVKNENTFALIISNEEYDMAANVDNATNDGLAFREYCLNTFGIPDENIRQYSNLSFGKMRKSVTDMLDLAEMLNGQANLIIYYAGHGIPDNKTKDAFLMPVDADGTDTSICMSLADLYDKINSKNLNRCVLFLDACFSGAQRGGDMIVAARGVKLKPTEKIPEGKTIVFSATSGDEAAFSHKNERHGLFTYFLLSKLQETKGKVSLGELADYLHDKVAFESRRINNTSQTPRVTVAPGISDTWKSIKLIK